MTHLEDADHLGRPVDRPHIVGRVELLEREQALAALANAHAAAARGDGRAILIGRRARHRQDRRRDPVRARPRPRRRRPVGRLRRPSTPRPLGPFHDLDAPALKAALAAGAAPHELHALPIDALRTPPAPTVLVLEDVHWADDATLDVITMFSRRIAGCLAAGADIPERRGPPEHPLQVAFATAVGSSTFIELEPLSREAVASLPDEDADGLYALTGGNPFFVVRSARQRASCRWSIGTRGLGRAARLDDAARHLVELKVSVVPNRIGTGVLDAALPDWPAAAEQPEQRQLLEVHPAHVRFRHELARHATRSSVPAARRRRLHAGDPRGAHPCRGRPHRDRPPRRGGKRPGCRGRLRADRGAARRRGGFEPRGVRGHRSYRRVRDEAVTGGPGATSRGACTGGLCRRPARRGVPGSPAGDRGYREVGDTVAVGRCTRILSRFHWYAGDGDAARRAAGEAIDILEPEGESLELARAYSGLSQLAMLAEHPDEAIRLGQRALVLATRLGDDGTRAHALVNIGSAGSRATPTYRRAAPGVRARGRRGRSPRSDPRLGESRLH